MEGLCNSITNTSMFCSLPYQGSTCVELNYGLGYLWSTSRCAEEKRFVCESGLKGI